MCFKRLNFCLTSFFGHIFISVCHKTSVATRPLVYSNLRENCLLKSKIHTHASWVALGVEVCPGAKVGGGFVVGGGLVAFCVTTLSPTSDTFPNNEQSHAILDSLR